MTGPQGSGNHLFSKIFAKPSKGYELAYLLVGTRDR